MNSESIFEKVRDVFADVADLSPDEITLKSSLLDELDLSSLEVMSAISDLEGIFSVRISERVLRSFIYIEDIVNHLASVV